MHLQKKMILALIGQKQSGKSTASKYLQEKYGFKPRNFKDELIREIKIYLPDFVKKECELYNCTEAELFEKKPGHIRQIMQNFGTELRRTQDNDYWVKRWKYYQQFDDSKTVVDDCRFLNEANAIKQLGGKIIKIIRTGQINNDTHQSEQEYLQIQPDYIIEVGDGEHAKLYIELNKIYESETIYSGL